MGKGTTILEQILHLIPDTLFDSLVEQYKVSKGTRTMKARNHLAVMLYAQLAGLPSLRTIEKATRAVTPSQRRCGIIPARHSTLAEANRRISPDFYKTLYLQLKALYQGRFSRHKFKLPGKLYSLDSTTITLCKSLCTWADFRKRKGGMKIHTLLDHDGCLPSFLSITAARPHDVKEGRKMKFKKGDTVVFDRAYLDSTWFHELCEQGVCFVIRLKKNVAFGYETRRSISQEDARQGIRADWIGGFEGKCAEQCPDTLRYIRSVDPETGKKVELLTNLLDAEAGMIADLYRNRWKIETFFKEAKGELQIKTLLSTDKEAIEVQIWVAMIAYLLMRVLQQKSKNTITSHYLKIFIATHLLMEIPVAQAWQDIQRTKRKRKKSQKRATRNSVKSTGQ